MELHFIFTGESLVPFCIREKNSSCFLAIMWVLGSSVLPHRKVFFNGRDRASPEGSKVVLMRLCGSRLWLFQNFPLLKTK